LKSRLFEMKKVIFLFKLYLHS